MFIEMSLTAVSAFQAAEQRGSSASELQRGLQAIEKATKEAWYAEFCFCTVAPKGMGKLSNQILNASVTRACKVLGRPVPTAFLEAGPVSDDFPAIWEDLHHEMHEVLNRPAPRTVKVMPTPPILVDEVVNKNGCASGY
ncbi:hypothetical protein ACIOJD_26105 [Streptomyces sp. NPDC088116]|uniref:hypothetical protein n=1 Tax=Streptomyces sp. NPDC088116 TaxID=3365825 RepID=UPI0038054416